ncbi:MAG: sulfotransferase [Hyphomonas sp.]|nr:sulfotransferase [Hyphomonas sp.]
MEGWIAAARLSQMANDFAGMRDHLARALQLAPGSPLAHLMDVEAQILLGEINAARTALADMETKAGIDAAWNGRLSEAYTQCGDHVSAERCSRRAHELVPTDPAFAHALAAALLANGKLTEAETLLDELIKSCPQEHDAYYNRATLRRQTPDSNHVDEIRERIESEGHNLAASVQLHYALAHELDDLGSHDESFAALKTGADARRRMMAYRVAADTDTMAKIAEVFDEAFFSRTLDGCPDASPIFITGFPRSGTTLVDRILSAHPQVDSLGELTDFPMALIAQAGTAGSKQDLIKQSASLDMRALGEAYIKRTRQRANGNRFFIDKAPSNFLYIGLIAASLPYARIIHLNRNPLDNALGMYKALFRMGYPFSYDFNDLAAYMRAKNRLMTHWRSVLPGRIIDVSYESIVTEQEAETRRLLAACGLEWDPACLDFHLNDSPSATASAAQVRRPLYASSVGRWKKYRKHLGPLIEALEVES